MARGWHGDPYRHSLAARGVRTKMMISGMLDRNIYKDYNILSGGYQANRCISHTLENNPDLWSRSHRVLDDADTIIALEGSSTGDMFPGIDPNKITGFIRFRRRPISGRSEMGYELSYLEVRKDHQGEGIGYAMLGTFFDRVVQYDNHVYVAYGSPEGQIFFEKFINDPKVRNELWERDITIGIEE